MCDFKLIACVASKVLLFTQNCYYNYALILSVCSQRLDICKKFQQFLNEMKDILTGLEVALIECQSEAQSVCISFMFPIIDMVLYNCI